MRGNGNARYIESFLVGSRVEHLRQRERVTASDRRVQAEVRNFLRDATEPLVSHFIAQKTKP